MIPYQLALIAIVYLCLGYTKADFSPTMRRGAAMCLRVLADRLEAGLPVVQEAGR